MLHRPTLAYGLRVSVAFELLVSFVKSSFILEWQRALKLLSTIWVMWTFLLCSKVSSLSCSIRGAVWASLGSSMITRAAAFWIISSLVTVVDLQHETRWTRIQGAF